MHFFGRNIFLCLVVPILLCSCDLINQSGRDTEGIEAWQPHLEPVTLSKDTPLAIRETIYVPVYSHIYSEDRMRLVELAETVSVRNTDMDHPIILTSVRHYGSDGALLKGYLTSPVLIKPLATADFVVARSDISGGTGANFIVEWAARTKVSEPIVESVMVNARAAGSISFISRGAVIKRQECPVK